MQIGIRFTSESRIVAARFRGLRSCRVQLFQVPVPRRGVTEVLVDIQEGVGPSVFRISERLSGSV